MTHRRGFALAPTIWLIAPALAASTLGCGDAQMDATVAGSGDSDAEIQPFGTCAEGGNGTVPANLDEALVELEKILNPAHLEEVKRRDPIEFHHGLGTALRNCWGLWAGGSGLAGWFTEQGITHPDDMSSVVLTSFHRKLNGVDLDVAGQIAEHKAYWDKQREDYESGASSGNSIFNVVEFVEGSGWVSIHGDDIPRVDELFGPLIEHARSAIEACWKKQPRTPGNSAVDTAIEIAIDADGRLASAVVEDSAIPETDAACLAEALVGASAPEHKGASYVVVFQTYRMIDPIP
jgi:hypothetical protein